MKKIEHKDFFELMKPQKGRPKKLDDKQIFASRKKGKTLAELAEEYCVTRGAIQASLRRFKTGSEPATNVKDQED